MSLAARLRQHCQQCLETIRQAPLYGVEGREVALADGYLPLLLDYSHEDRAAKGLRVFQADQQKAPAVYFEAAQIIAESPWLLLHGPEGSGKSTLARHLLWQQATAYLADERVALPLLVDVQSDTVPELLSEALAAARPVLLIIDSVEHWQAETLFAHVQRYTADHKALRVLLLGRSDPCAEWALAGPWQRHRLLPLLTDQRQVFIDQRWPGLGDSFAARGDTDLLSRPANFALALGGCEASTELALVQCWAALEGIARTALFNSRYVQGRLAVSQVRGASAVTLAGLLQANPQQWSEPLLQLGIARAQAGEDLGELIGALAEAGPRGVLLACDLAQRDVATRRAPLLASLLAIVEAGHDPLALRVRASQWLARWGDPRDLQALVEIPAGRLTMGSERHPNSAPVATLSLAAFRMGRYPVCNRDYGRFITATGRPWRSEDGRRPERATAPAVDLTWHDARAYCAWLTLQWRAQGRLAADETLCLPSEPQWEYAARGLQGADADRDVYPWGSGWREGHGNGEEASLNDTCAVGLFPQGRSIWGCDDLCGQVWEWTSTLWGEDMAQPRFAYPYADDGREAATAAPQVRRVLRGGCFSSPGFKACATYRGSLEPDGFWRGNGFRVAVVSTRG